MFSCLWKVLREKEFSNQAGSQRVSSTKSLEGKMKKVIFLTTILRFQPQINYTHLLSEKEKRIIKDSLRLERIFFWFWQSIISHTQYILNIRRILKFLCGTHKIKIQGVCIYGT